MRSRQEYLDLKKWFYRRRGMLNEFWLPSYEHNFNVVSASSSTLIVKNESYLDVKKSIAIKSNGVWTVHEITNQSTTGANKTLLVEPSLPTKIDRISYLDLYRLGADSIEFRFMGNDIIEATVPIIELQP